MALRPGYYLLEKRQLGQDVLRPRTTMSIIAFLRAVQREEPLPEEICVVGLERLLHEASDPRGAARVLQRALGNPRAASYLRHRGPAVVLPLEYLEYVNYWRAGIRQGQRGDPREVFHLEWVFPRAEIESVGKTDLCYCML